MSSNNDRAHDPTKPYGSHPQFVDIGVLDRSGRLPSDHLEEIVPGVAVVKEEVIQKAHDVAVERGELIPPKSLDDLPRAGEAIKVATNIISRTHDPNRVKRYGEGITQTEDTQ